MMRPSWDDTFMNICEIIKKQSTCARIQTATIIVDEEKNIISIGYNGTNKGKEHCTDYWKRTYGKPLTEIENYRAIHREWSRKNEIHAEMNAIIKLQKKSDNLTLYTILSPCIDCAKLILACKIKKVIYQTLYDDITGLNFLEENGVETIHLI